MTSILRSFSIGLVAVGLLSAPSRQAAAQPKPAPAPAPAKPSLGESLSPTAKAEYESAKLLYTNGDFGNALIKFSSAYEQSKDPRLLWNMAACEKGRRRYAKALELVRRFAGDASGVVSEQEKSEASQLIIVLEPLTTKLKVNVSEPGAEVAVDGEILGTSPLDPVVVDLSAKTVTARKDGFGEATANLTNTGGNEVAVDLVLKKVVHEGRVVVNAGPKDAIAIDGKLVGTGSWSGVLPSGGHTLKVTAQGMKPYQTEMLVSDDRPREISVTLEAESAKIPVWAWIAGGVLATGGLAVGGFFLFRPEPSYDGPTGNLAPGIVQASRPLR